MSSLSSIIDCLREQCTCHAFKWVQSQFFLVKKNLFHHYIRLTNKAYQWLSTTVMCHFNVSGPFNYWKLEKSHCIFIRMAKSYFIVLCYVLVTLVLYNSGSATYSFALIQVYSKVRCHIYKQILQTCKKSSGHFIHFPCRCTKKHLLGYIVILHANIHS